MVVPSAVGTATVGGFTGAGLLAGGCGIMWELTPQQQFVDSQVLDCELVVVATAVGTATVGGFTGAGLLAGGCDILWELSPQQQLVDSQVLDC